MGEYDGSGTILRRYVPGPGTDEPLVWYEGAGTGDRRWLHADTQNSVIGYSDSSGNSGATYAYDPYGLPDTWSASASRYRYTGQTLIPEAHLYDYKARMYDPMAGRFLQTDPVGYDSDINLYAYAGNDPINWTDPSGLVTCAVEDKACIAAALAEPTTVQGFAVTGSRNPVGMPIDYFGDHIQGTSGGPGGAGKGGGGTIGKPQNNQPQGNAPVDPCPQSRQAAAAVANDLPVGTNPNSEESLNYEAALEQSESNNDNIAIFAITLGTAIAVVPEALEAIGLRGIAAVAKARPYSTSVAGVGFGAIFSTTSSKARLAAVKA